jgi:diadenosine tetraphosphate (Ap4A) HIT family hydrolase
MSGNGWERLVRGEDCPLCAPRAASNEHWDLVSRLSVASMYLAKNQSYRGQSLVIFDSHHASVPSQLSPDEWRAFCADLYIAQSAVSRTVRPDHMNIELLGNVVPHLHWHVVPRYRNDSRWGSPIWLTSLADIPDTRLADRDRETLIGELRNAIGAQTAGGERF